MRQLFISTLSTEEAIKNWTIMKRQWAQKKLSRDGQYMKRQYLHWAQKKLFMYCHLKLLLWQCRYWMRHSWYLHWAIKKKLSLEWKNRQYMKRQYLHWAQKKLSRMDNTWRDNIYIEHRRSYQEWTIHEETISTLSTEEAIKNGQYMKRQYLHWAQKKLSRMDNTWRDNIYIEHRRSYQEWTIHEETLSTLSTEEAIKNGQYMKRQYLSTLKHRRSYHEWTIHEETISTLSTEEAIKNGQYMKRQYLHWAQKKLSRMDNTWRDNIYIEHRRSYQEWTIHEAIYIAQRYCYQEWTIHEETISTLSTEEAINEWTIHDRLSTLSKRSYQEYLHWAIRMDNHEAIKEAIIVSSCNGQYMKRQYLHWAQKKLSRIDNTWRRSYLCTMKLSRMDNTWRDNIYIEHRRSYQECDNTWWDNIYIEHRRSYQEWTIHEETISTLSTEEAIKNGQYMKRQYLHWAQKKLSRIDNTWRDNIYIEHRRSYQEWTIHEETISTLSTEEAIKNGQYMKRQYLHWAQKKLSRIDNTWRDNIYIEHRRSYQEWTIHEETISTLSTEEDIKNGQYMKRQYLHHRRISRMDNTW